MFYATILILVFYMQAIIRNASNLRFPWCELSCLFKVPKHVLVKFGKYKKLYVFVTVFLLELCKVYLPLT